MEGTTASRCGSCGSLPYYCMLLPLMRLPMHTHLPPPAGSKAPPTTDCSAFTIWLFWTAFGKGPDDLNGDGWSGSNSYTGTQASHGQQVSAASQDCGKPAPVDSAAPCDLVFYGPFPHDHVALYIGKTKFGGKEFEHAVATFGKDGPVEIRDAYYHDKCLTQVRRYPSFFSH